MCVGEGSFAWRYRSKTKTAASGLLMEDTLTTVTGSTPARGSIHGGSIMRTTRVARVTDGDGVQRSRRYWTGAEFCEVVDRSPYTAQRWRSEGGGPPFLKIGGRVMYDEERVHEWLASHEQTSTSNEGH